ncbi:MAG: ATP-binding protein [Dokdonella sp.]
MIALLIVNLAMALVAGIATQRWLRLRAQLGAERRIAGTALAECEALAHDRAVAGERERIYNDLHDDLGASLLHLIYTSSTPQQADGLRAVMQNLRDVVTRSRGTPGTLRDVLGDIRREAEQRLHAVNIVLDWSITAALPDPMLDNETSLHLHRIVREAISNVVRHAQARRLRIRIAGNKVRLAIEITDNGSGFKSGSHDGSGTRTMRERAGEIAASIDWGSGTEGGTKVLLTLPLPAIPD